MDIRGLDTADMPAVRVAAEAIAARYYPELIGDIARERDILLELKGSAHHYAKVIGPKGDPDAVLLAKAGDNLWACKRHATVLLWYSKKPGAGYKLLRDFKDWVKLQKHMVLAGFIDDFDMDIRMIGLLRRLGFVQRGGAYVLFPGGAKR